jgi:hypothetical protein
MLARPRHFEFRVGVVATQLIVVIPVFRHGIDVNGRGMEIEPVSYTRRDNEHSGPLSIGLH